MTAHPVVLANSPAELDPAVRAFTHDLILSLADCKRLLGTRYAGWILGAPELEAGIACASMAQDEWGHARLLYALLKEFGADIERLEHGREPAEYGSMAVLDQPVSDWVRLVAINVLVDSALTIQLEAARGSTYLPVRQRAEKLLNEEQFHAAHGAAWFRRLLRAGDTPRNALLQEVRVIGPVCLRWFGPDSDRAGMLREAGLVDAVGDVLRQRYLDRLAPLLDEADLTAELAGLVLDFTDFDEAVRRQPGSAPDAETIRRVRGDRNRAFLMD